MPLAGVEMVSAKAQSAAPAVLRICSASARRARRSAQTYIVAKRLVGDHRDPAREHDASL